MTRRHRRPLAALLLALAVVATATLGNAATITVNAASIASFTVTHPCPGGATAVPSAASGTLFMGVTVTLPSAACSGRVVQVTVLDGTTVVATGQATVADATATVTGLDAYLAHPDHIVRATVGGWHLPTAWVYDPPPAPPAGIIVAGNGRTVVTFLSDWYDAGGMVCVPVEVKSDAGNQTWRVDIDTTAPPFIGSTPIFTGLHAPYLTTDPVPGMPGWIAVTGTGQYATVMHHKDPILFNICG